MTRDARALPARLGHVLCLDDFERLARRHLPAPVFAYVCGGVERNHSVPRGLLPYAPAGPWCTGSPATSRSA